MKFYNSVFGFLSSYQALFVTRLHKKGVVTIPRELENESPSIHVISTIL